MGTRFFLDTPLWALFLITFLILYISIEGGIFLGKVHRNKMETEDRSPIGSIVSAALGLLAFFTAFTFGISASRFDERRGLVVEEANAIGTTYRRAGYLSEPQQAEIRKLLKEYVDVRLHAVQKNALEEGIKRSDALLEALWAEAIVVAKQNPNSEMGALFIESLNDVIELHTKRVSVGGRLRIPFVIWFALYAVGIFSIGTLGYQFGLSHTRYVGVSFLLILAFTSVLLLTLDLDRPAEGLIRISQQSLLDLKTQIAG